MKEDKLIYTVIDLQEKLVPAMEGRQRLLENTARLIRGLKALKIPGVATTQYAKGLGPITAEIAEALDGGEAVDKRTFSVMGCREFREKFVPMAEDRDVIVFGIETHICLMQSALDMLKAGYRVYIPADCVASRREYDRSAALDRLSREGCTVTTSESLLFEIMRSADHPQFKTVSAIVK